MMSDEQIIEIDAQRKGSDPDRSRYIVNQAVKQGGRTVRSGNTLFVFIGDGKGKVQFMWFTADQDKKFTDAVNDLLGMLKKSKAKSAYSVYGYPPANNWFRAVDTKYKPKVTKRDQYFQAEMRL